jgi:HPt (histidine-containing phosphotransfer) domain-containing protein
MTANAMASDREACFAAGMNDHIGKPFDMNQLIDVLCKHAGLAVVGAPVITIPAPITAPPSGANDIAIAHQIDLVGAVKRLAGNKGLYLRMLPKYLSELDRLPSGISAALEKEDVAAVTRALHSLKGLSATMGVTLLASAFSLGEKALLASDVSTQARDEILHNIFALVDEITPNIEQLHQALQAELA